MLVAYALRILGLAELPVCLVPSALPPAVQRSDRALAPLLDTHASACQPALILNLLPLLTRHVHLVHHTTATTICALSTCVIAIFLNLGDQLTVVHVILALLAIGYRQAPVFLELRVFYPATLR